MPESAEKGEKGFQIWPGETYYDHGLASTLRATNRNKVCERQEEERLLRDGYGLRAESYVCSLKAGVPQFY